jgi:hypothetical protein
MGRAGLLAFRRPDEQNKGMDSSSAISSAVAGITGSGLSSQIAVSVLSSTESAEKAQITTLFSSIGLGRNVDASA